MFNEPEWLRLLFLLAAQQWLNEMSKDLVLILPVENKKKLFRKTYMLTPVALSHIIERHYYKIPRHPQAGKFHISIPEIVQLVRDASCSLASPLAGTLNFQRTIQCPGRIGYDKKVNP